MKKLLFLFAFLPSILIAQQQPFGYNATWIFEYDEAGFSGVDSLYYEKDTVYLGETWQYLNRGTNGLGRMFLQTKNDTVYYLENGQKLMLYDFNAGIGDSWGFARNDTSFGCTDNNLATVTAIGFDTISGVPVSYQVVEDAMDTVNNQYRCSSTFCMGGKIYDRIGQFSAILYPWANICNGGSFKTAGTYIYKLRCYHDDNIHVNFTQHSCLTGIGVEEEALAEINIHPNPSNGYVFIDTENTVVKTEIYNITGQKLRVFKNQNIIELPQQNGVYLLHITLKNGAVLVENVVKH